MKILDLRKYLVDKYKDKKFDLRKNWCFELLNSRDDMEAEEIITIFYYLRSLAFAKPLFSLFRIIKKMGLKDQFLLSQSDKCLGGEILVNFAGENKLISASKYMDETGKYYLPDQIMIRGLFLEVENQKEYELLFSRSCRSERLVRQRMQEDKKPAIVLITERGRPDYYIISSRLLLSEKRQGEKKAEVGNLTRWGSNISY